MKVYSISYSTLFHELAEDHQYPQVLAIGDFDGVHLGHQAVLQRALDTARRFEQPASVMTFYPHPREVLGKEGYKESLTPLEAKLKHFEAMGLDRAYVVQFDQEFARMLPEEFVQKVLMGLHAQTVVVGFDFTFGYKGLGNADTLSTQSKGKFAVEVVRPFHLSGEKVSSTLIRESLNEGNVERAKQLLGRPYQISGSVVTGEGRGRTIGIPTANIQTDEAYVIPARGVYAVRVHALDQTFDGVMNIGWKPTFSADSGIVTLEAHLFDFSGDLYGQHVVVNFLSFIRNERKFNSAVELVEQIKLDITKSKEILTKSLL